MTEYEHKIYLSDGTVMTEAEYEAAIASGEIIDKGYGILKRAFKETKEKLRQPQSD